MSHPKTHDSAVIFDVDGVLLDLSHDEEEIFFQAFARYCDPSKLSRDWNSYRIRNDDDIINEIMELNGISADQKPLILTRYMSCLKQALNSQAVVSIPVPGTVELLHQLAGKTRLGIATANFVDAARLRLTAANLWDDVRHTAFGADGGGHKSEILQRAIAAVNVPPDRILFIGDNLNDVTAGLHNKVHFIGFSLDPQRRSLLRANGAVHVTSSHQENLSLIRQLLAI